MTTTHQRRYCTNADQKLILQNLVVMCDGEISDINADEIIIDPFVKHDTKLSGWSPLEEMELSEGRFNLSGVQISLYDKVLNKEVLFTEIEVPMFVWNDKDIEDDYLEKLSDRIIETAKKKVVIDPADEQEPEEEVIVDEAVLAELKAAEEAHELEEAKKSELAEEERLAKEEAEREPTEFEKEIKAYEANGYLTKDFDFEGTTFTAVIKDKNRSYVLAEKDGQILQKRIKEVSSNDNSNNYDFEGTKIVFDKIEKNILIG